MEDYGKTFEDYLSILNRRRLLILISVLAISLPGVYIAYSIPATYQSTAKILIEQQELAQDLVRPTAKNYVEEQIAEVGQRVMSTTNLSLLIEKYRLFPELTAAGSVQNAVATLRENTLITPELAEVVNPNNGRTMMATISFDISFDYSEAETTQKVAQELADLYLRENVATRTAQMQQTVRFLEADTERLRTKVEETSTALADFKERNASNLPGMMNFQLQSIERTERQIDELDRDIRDAFERKLVLEGEIIDAAESAVAYDENGEPILGTAARLAELQNRKIQLLSIYSAEHPDVVQAQKEIDVLTAGSGSTGSSIAGLQEQVNSATAQLFAARQNYSDDHPDVKNAERVLAASENELARALAQGRRLPPPTIDDPVTRQLRIRIRAEQSTIDANTARRNELRARLDQSEQNMIRLPQIEREFEALNQAAEISRGQFNEASQKLADARKFELLETEGGGGDQFRILERPTIPAKPYKPNRTAIMMLAMVLSLGVGIILATIIDTLDDTVKGSKDIMQLVNSPPLAVIPYLEMPDERRKRIVGNVATSGFVVGGIVAAIAIANFAG